MLIVADITSNQMRPKKGELLTAFNRGDIQTVMRLAEDIPDFEKVNIPGIVIQYKGGEEILTPLSVTILHGNYHLCRLLVEDGHSLVGDSKDPNILRPLSLALHFKQFDIAELLIELGADVNMLDNNKNTYPLFWAINKKLSTNAIDVIISAGFPVNAFVIRNEKMTGLHLAVLENNIKAVKTLIKYPLDFNIVNSSGETALGIAIRRNFLETVKLLVEKGASLHNRNSSWCPLFIAIKFEHVKMVELLLDLGADLQEGWINGEISPPLLGAISQLNMDIVMLLLERGANVKARNSQTRETALNVATYSHIGLKYQGETLKAIQLKISKALIDKGADVNAEDEEGVTPLDSAICSENSELCKLLIREGAQVRRTGEHLMPFIIHRKVSHKFEYICCSPAFKCLELVKLCLERGGDYNSPCLGITPYHCVMAKHNYDMVRAFWQHGCPYDQPEVIPGKMKELLEYEPDSRDKELLSLQAEFMNGIESNRLDLVENALKKGAEPKGCSMKIPSTLHYVAASGNHNIARVLLENGVAINKINEKGHTPLYIAVAKKNLQVCKVLLKYGACIDYRNKKLAKNKTIKVIVQDNDQVFILFRKIYKCFKFAKQGNGKLLKVLHKLKTKGDEEMVQILMNCVNNKGFTLLATVLGHGFVNLAEDLMKFRLASINH